MKVRNPIASFRVVDRGATSWVDRAIDVAAAIVARHQGLLGGIVIGALAVLVMTMDGNEQIARERERARQAEEREAAIATWHRDRNVRVTLEGDPATVANLAAQVATAVQ